MAGTEYPFCLPKEEFDKEVTYNVPPEERKGGFRDVKSASMLRIVEMITRLDYHDSGFIQDLVLTYRDFATPHDFFDLLMRRNEPPPASATQEQKKRFESEKAFILSSTILIVRRWLPNLRASDFTSNPEFYSKILQFINSTLDDHHAELFALLWKAKSPPVKSPPEAPKLQSAASTVKIIKQTPTSPPPLTRTNSILAFNLLSPKSDRTLSPDPEKEAPSSHAQFSPEQIAQELTVLDHEYYCAIHGHEFIGQAWAKNAADAPNIVAFTKWFNRVSNWIITKIVSKEQPEQRAAVIEGFIAIAMHFHELKNYNGCMVVFSSLHNAAVSRLKQTWHLVSPKSIADLDMIEFLLSPEKNFKNYRRMIQEIWSQTDPCIPVVGIFLSDMTFMYENSSLINGLVNVERVFLLGERIKEFLGYQKRLFTNLKSVEQLREYILSERVCDESETFSLSKLREDSSQTPPPSHNKKRISVYPTASKLRMMDLSTDEVLTESANSSLSERDWQILLTGAKEKRFGSGSIIFDEGDKVPYIYRVVSGKVRRRTSTSGAVSGVAVHNQLVGDTAFLNSGISVYRAIADKDTVLMAIDVSFISKIFESDFELAATFYKTISIGLVHQFRAGLRSMSVDNPLGASVEDDDYEEPQEDSKSAKDLEFCTKFNLPVDEVVIKSCPCKHSSVSGEVFISQHYICFHGSVLGLTKQKIYPLNDVSRVDKLEKTLIINKLNSSKTVRKFTFKTLQDAKDIHGIVTSIWKSQKTKVPGAPASPGSPPGSPISPTRSAPKSILPTKDEWDIIMKGAKLHSYKKGDVIVHENTECRKLYKIVSGKCTMETEVSPGRNEISNVLRDNDLFGEPTFLLGGDIQTTVIAQTDVEINVLESSFVHALLNSKVNLAPKFYRYLAHTILKRLLNFQDKTGLNYTPSNRTPTK